MKIRDYLIGKDSPPYIIAELSGNHNQSLDRALEIVNAGAEAGVHAIKLQTYTADSMTLDCTGAGFDILDEENLWKGQTLYQVYTEASTPREWHEPIMKHCEKLKLACFSTPFDSNAVDFLETLNVPAYKIASAENNHIPLLKKVADTGKPVMMSTGMASLEELEEAVQTLRDHGCKDLALLKCTSSYPALPENANILTIPQLREHFQCEAGLSDHTMGIGVAIASAALGASVIEKHFTLRRADGGVDSAFSMEPEEMKLIAHETKTAWLSLGKVSFGCSNEFEEKSLKYRRSIYIAKDIKAGTKLDSDNMRVIRPGFGLPPKHYESLLGKTINADSSKGTPLDWSLIH